jgi:hypothetical protein
LKPPLSTGGEIGDRGISNGGTGQCHVAVIGDADRVGNHLAGMIRRAARHRGRLHQRDVRVLVDQDRHRSIRCRTLRGRTRRRVVVGQGRVDHPAIVDVVLRDGVADGELPGLADAQGAVVVGIAVIESVMIGIDRGGLSDRC